MLLKRIGDDDRISNSESFFAVETDSTMLAQANRTPVAYEYERADAKPMDHIRVTDPPLGTITTLMDGTGRIRNLEAGDR